MRIAGHLRVVCGLVAFWATAAQTPPATQTPPQSQTAPPAGGQSGTGGAQTTPPAAPAGAQPAAPETQAAVNPNAPETVTREAPATFRTSVNMVLVPVVVRDKAGRAVGGFQQEDFQVFDRNKVQIITRFTVEKSGIPIRGNAPRKPGETPAEPAPTALPERFVAYLFDDIHTVFADLARTRDAAARHIATLRPTDRAAIYTTSGQNNLDFTDDRDQIHEALQRLMPRPLLMRNFRECPDISYYMANLIVEHNDMMALQTATTETILCMGLPADSSSVATAQNIARSTAQRVISQGDQETRVALSVVRDVIRRMSAMPGQRTIILASSGFLTLETQQEKAEIMDRAVRSSVIINTIDSRGLYVDPVIDASRPGGFTAVSQDKDRYDREAAQRGADVLAEFAAGTGGTFIQNTNDLDAGYQRVATAPEYIYILGFSPQNLKLDGSYHALKVTIKEPAGLTSSARRGYYAPRRLNDPMETAKEEIREALFSKEELRELPVDLHTQFFKSSGDNARVTILTHVDLKNLRFRKAETRNNNTLTITAALFDRNGNYVTGSQKILEMRLKDETLEKRAEAGFTVRSSFDVKPGTYLVRLVVRDAEGQQMSAANGAVEIP
jgi:VWFA-related protein